MSSSPSGVGGCDRAPLAQCTNNLGAAASCKCPIGFEGTGSGEDGCTDLDECLVNNGGCDSKPLAHCTNQEGASATCMCPQGYQGIGAGDGGCRKLFTYDATTVADPVTALVWRLPTQQELLSIVDDSRDNPGIDLEAFPNTPSMWFWASDVSPKQGRHGTVNVSVGMIKVTGEHDSDSQILVRCVHE